MKKKILIIDDSKGKAFKGISTIYIDELRRIIKNDKKDDIDIDIIAKDYHTTIDAVKEAKAIKEKQDQNAYDVVIINLGINDCSPRLLNKFWREKLMMLPQKISFLIRVYILRKYRKILFKIFGSRLLVTEKEFVSNIKQINRIIKPKKMIVMNICRTNKELERKLPGVNENIAKFNKMISTIDKKDNITVLDTDTITRKIGTEKATIDGVHYMEDTCRIIAEKLSIMI